jgi:hypothetical protein
MIIKKENLNLRFDVGFGTNSFYLGIAEHFLKPWINLNNLMDRVSLQ